MFFTRRFLPYFTTQCLGALNDNLYKNSLILLVAFSQTGDLPFSTSLFVNLAAGLFILPFFLFSAHAGQMADNMDKARLIKRLKLGELVIMMGGAFAILTQSYAAMLVLLFMMGTQSAYFGPAKYALLPQALKPNELVSGNAWVETGTFLSILFGTLSAGLIATLPNHHIIAAVTVIVLAISGLVSSHFIPALPSKHTQKSNTNTRTILKQAKSNKGVWLSILAISWFWFLGATYLTQFPNFTKQVLNADPAVVSILLTLFSVGIAVGSMIYGRFSDKRIELGLLPFALIGISFFGLDMLQAVSHTQVSLPLENASSFITNTDHYRFMFDLLMIGVCGGVYIVPLYTSLQTQSEEKQRAKMVAANNIINALFMVVSAIASIVVLDVLDGSIEHLFTLISVANIVVAYHIYRHVSANTHRIICLAVSKLMYRIKTKGVPSIPVKGGALVVANHVSLIDAILIMAVSPRPVRFVMDKSISEIPVLRHLFKHSKVIPICSPKQCQKTYDNAFIAIDSALESEELVCIFPEGRLTHNGELSPFKPGVLKILKQRSVPVYPIALNGLWGSFFSRKVRKGFKHLPTRFWSRLEISYGEPMYQPTLEQMKACIQTLLAAKAPHLKTNS